MATDTHITPHGEASGLDRRSLIKRAAAVGAAAWTAPVIIGSLASPAGALTVPCGCFKAVLDANCTLAFQNNNDCSPTVSTSICSTVVPQNVVSADYVPSDFCLSITTTPSGPFAGGCNLPLDRYVLVSIGSGCDCVIEAAEAKVVGVGGCIAGVGAGGTKIVTFDKLNATDRWKSFTLIIRCC